MINPKYVVNLDERIFATTSCAELAQLSAEALAYFTHLQITITAQISIFGTLVTPPTDLTSVISWIEKLITTLTGPYAKLITAQEELIALEAITTALIVEKYSTLKCPLFSLTNLYAVMNSPLFGASVNGISVYGGGSR